MKINKNQEILSPVRKIVNIMSYEFTQPRELDQTPCKMFDDFPYVSLTERILKAQANGQAYEEMVRNFYIPEHQRDLDDVVDPETLETPVDFAENGADQITAYQSFLKHRLEKDAMVRQYRAYEQSLQEKKKKEGMKSPVASATPNKDSDNSIAT